jgi:hypothetical protein
MSTLWPYKRRIGDRAANLLLEGRIESDLPTIQDDRDQLCIWVQPFQFVAERRNIIRARLAI